LGGKLPLAASFVAGALVAVLLAVHTVRFVELFVPLTCEEKHMVEALPSRLALVVAAAGFIGIFGLALDVIHTSTDPRYDLWVRCFSLAAGTTAFLGAGLALTGPLGAAAVFWAIFLVGGIASAVILLIWCYRLWRSSNRKA